MNRKIKIFIAFTIFLFCSAFYFKFAFGKDASFEFMWADMVLLLISLMAAVVAMIILTQRSKKEEALDNEALELKEFSERSAIDFDGDEFV